MQQAETRGVGKRGGGGGKRGSESGIRNLGVCVQTSKKGGASKVRGRYIPKALIQEAGHRMIDLEMDARGSAGLGGRERFAIGSSTRCPPDVHGERVEEIE